MSGSFSIGRIAGIRIEVNASWLIILVLLTVSLATSWFPSAIPGASFGLYLGLGFLASVLLFASVLLHELAHSLVARSRGLNVSSITLFIFGGVSNLEQEPRTAGDEFELSVVGPLTSLLIGGVCFAISRVVPSNSHALLSLLDYLALTNVLLGAFNLIPGFPLDGGRVFRSIIWGITGNLRTATRVATGVGQFVAYLFIFWGIIQVFGGNLFGGIWTGFIGWFLLNAAQSANAQSVLQNVFAGVTVGQVMQPVTAVTQANRSLSQLVYETIYPTGAQVLPVTQMDRFAGIITLTEVNQHPQNQWDQVTVGQAMVPAAQLHTVQPDQPLTDALPLMVGPERDIVPVVDADDRLVGVLTRMNVLRLIETRRTLNIPHPRTQTAQPVGVTTPAGTPSAKDQQLPSAS
jgi:Zn-dependent protease/predicted transcriptional regulator